MSYAGILDFIKGDKHEKVDAGNIPINENGQAVDLAMESQSQRTIERGIESLLGEISSAKTIIKQKETDAEKATGIEAHITGVRQKISDLAAHTHIIPTDHLRKCPVCDKPLFSIRTHTIAWSEVPGMFASPSNLFACGSQDCSVYGLVRVMS